MLLLNSWGCFTLKVSATLSQDTVYVDRWLICCHSSFTWGEWWVGWLRCCNNSSHAPKKPSFIDKHPTDHVVSRQDFSAPSQSCSGKSKHTTGLYIHTCLYQPPDSLYLWGRYKWHACMWVASPQGYPANKCCLDEHTSYIHTSL